jgi:hypothetical protein
MGIGIAGEKVAAGAVGEPVVAAMGRVTLRARRTSLVAGWVAVTAVLPARPRGSISSGAKPSLDFVDDGKDIGGILRVAGVELIGLLFYGSDHPQP